MLNYRPEIDGLRAIAVTSVVIYHAQFTIAGQPVLPGGFLGVDVFFVISGYLITSIILREIRNGTFSFANFYERRARRILPALLLVMLASVPFAWVLLLPDALTQYAGSVLASLGFGSNFWFLAEDSYTADASELKPFLHTWSLSIEEQFYLIFPPLLIVLSKIRRAPVLFVLVALLIVSLAYAEYASTSHPDAAFFLLPSRIWELLVGAILACMEQKLGRNPQRRLSRFFSLLGLVLILAPIFYFNDDMRHPSLLTAIPVSGVALTIWYSVREDPATRLLSLRPMVWIGLVSYSWYLWHFPIFVFSRLQDPGAPQFERVGQIAISLAAAILAYRLVEQPMRNRSDVPPRLFYPIVLIAIALLVAAQFKIFSSGGYPDRIGEVDRLLVEASEPWDNLRHNGRRCHMAKLEALCVFNAESGARPIILLGDSHAAALSRLVVAIGEAKARPVEIITSNGCPPILGTHPIRNGEPLETCTPQVVSQNVQYILDHRPADIIFALRLPLYLSGEFFDNKQGGSEDMSQKHQMVLNEDLLQESAGVDSQIAATFDKFLEAGHRVFLIYPIPEVGWHVPRMIKSALAGAPEQPVQARRRVYETLDLSIDLLLYRQRSERARGIYDSLGDRNGLYRINPEEIFCDGRRGRCLTHDAGGIYYHDDDHLSDYGASKLIKQVQDAGL